VKAIMTDIKKLIKNIDVILIKGEDDPVISNVEFDSRKVTPGTLFVAVKGTKSDGHDYINSAISSGASAVICENIPENPDHKICWIKTSDSAKLSVSFRRTFGDPSSI
jgi:UDP-N-acetylmuramoyl-L-alanyl-D-glutamate--2,6-diaminopimelate ligase